MKHLLAISIGPVQDFIAAARRTADLYAGSQLLVEIAKTIARTIQNNGGQLIFPAEVSKNGKQEVPDGPNKILAEITNGQPSSIAEGCRKAALEYLRGDGQGSSGVWGEAKNKIPQLDQALADAQIESFLEFYAAWLPWDGNGSSYENVRIKLDRLLAGRKTLRDFEQPEKGKHTKAGRPKSPLDPSRDCALDITGTQPVPFECQTDPLWLKKRETLDAVSLLKRVLGVTRGSDVPSTSLMAFRSIESEVEEKANHHLVDLKKMAKKAGSGIDHGDLMFESRSDEDELKARGLTDSERDTTRKARKAALKLIGRSECPPYFAVLAADGDQMGALIGQLKDKSKHKQFSEALSIFANQAGVIVAKHKGHLVYSGGDDVLALLPINRVLTCASELRSEFEKRLNEKVDIQEALKAMREAKKVGGTLSAGIAIVHHMEPLLVSLDQARSAEKEAKKIKPAIAIALHTRGGEPLTVREPWEGIIELENWINAFRDGVSRGFPYELRQLAREFQTPEMPFDLLEKEAQRIYDRKEGKSKPVLPGFEEKPDKLEEFSKKLVIARFLERYEVKP